MGFISRKAHILMLDANVVDAEDDEQAAPRNVMGASSQRAAYQEAKPVVSLGGASTSIQRSPLVTNQSRTPVWRSSSIMRVAGDAFQCKPATDLSRSWPAGYSLISRCG